MKPPRILATTLAVLGMACGAMAQAPANDNYANAQAIAGATVDITGDNTGAGLEAGEVNPAGYGGASVWYAWTAPANGWFTIHTSSVVPGNGLDTVLALYESGASPASATMLGQNDESCRWMDDFPLAVYPQNFGPSRLVFKAQAGTVYKLAVHGFFGNTGPFELHLAAEAAPDFIVTSVDFAPLTVDIGTAPVDANVTVGIDTTAPFSYADLSLLRSSNGSGAAYDSIDDTDLLAGTTTSGSYAALVTVPMYEQPGNWPVVISRYSSFLDDYMRWTSSGNDMVEDDYLIPQAGARLVVANSGTVDGDAPLITAVSGLPASVDLATGDATFDLVIDATDAVSGVASGDLRLVDSIGNSYFLGYLESFNLTGGDANNGTYTVPVTIYADGMGVPPGDYELEVSVEDVTANRRIQGPGGDSMPVGATTMITIAATPPANDAFADRLAVGPALPVAAAGSTRFATLEAGESDLDAATGASVWYEWTAGSSGWVGVSATSSGYYDPLVAVFTGTDVAALQELGRNNGVAGFGGGTGALVFHAVAGTTYKIAVYGDGVMYAQTGDFDLAIAAVSTPLARVTGFALLPSTIDVGTGPQSVTLQVTLETDSNFDFGSYMYAYLTPDDNVSGGDSVGAYISAAARVSGTATNGTYEVTLTLPGYYQPGDWQLAVDASHAGSTYRWSAYGANVVMDKYLIPQTGHLTMENTGGIDLADPVLLGVTGLPSFADVTSPVPVTLIIHATDDVAGIEGGTLYLTSNSGGSSTSYGLGSLTPADLVSGTATDGVYELSFALTDFFAAGNYELELNLTDTTGKIHRYGGFFGDAFPSGSTAMITISHGAGGYDSWAATQDFGSSGLSGVMDDANADGTENLLCYAFNIPPHGQMAAPMESGGTSGLPIITVVGDGPTRRLRIEYLQRSGGGSGLTYRPQFGGDLSGAGPAGWQDAVVPAPETIDSTWERVTVEDSVMGDPARFGRVVVDYVAP